MKHSLVLAAAAAAFVTLAPTAHAQNGNAFFGPQVGLFFPSDNVLKDRLGKSWFSFGAGRLNPNEAKQRKFASDWNATSKRANGNSIFMASISYGIINPLGDADAPLRPYFAVRGGISYIDYAVTTGPLTRVSGKRFGYNANAEVGVMIADRIMLSARYDIFSEHSGLNFNGLSLSLRYGLVRY